MSPFIANPSHGHVSFGFLGQSQYAITSTFQRGEIIEINVIQKEINDHFSFSFDTDFSSVTIKCPLCTLQF